MNIYNKFYIFLYYSNRNNTLEKHYLKKKKDIDCIQFFKIKIIDILTRKIVRNFNGDRNSGIKWSLILSSKNFPCFFELKNEKKTRSRVCKELCEKLRTLRYETTCTYVSEMKRSLSREDLELGDLSVCAFGIRGM